MEYWMGFEKLSGVAMGLVKSQWSCLKSQWGSLLMGLLQVETQYG